MSSTSAAKVDAGQLRAAPSSSSSTSLPPTATPANAVLAYDGASASAAARGTFGSHLPATGSSPPSDSAGESSSDGLQPAPGVGPHDDRADAAMTPTKGDTATTATTATATAATTEPSPTVQRGSGTRKRVFTFQKRWLHSLPIMEKVIPESVLENHAALKCAGLVGDDGKPLEGLAAQEVIVCMLCDDPNSTRDVLKIWSRLNCRRGRIENHLMSKHPEFMLLLKQKREAEGDLAVQIFLQTMREGRCNVRHEISAGLYSHMQAPILLPTQTPGLEMPVGAGHKRPLHPDEITPKPVAVFGSMLMSRDQADPLDVDARRKRAKPPLATSNGMESAAETTTLPLAGLQTTLDGRTFVITGCENAVMSRIASKFWFLGATVTMAFSDIGSMEAFATSHLNQLYEDSPRGGITPSYCAMQTRSQIKEWAQSVASKLPTGVDCLINFVDEEETTGTALGTAPAAGAVDDGTDADSELGYDRPRPPKSEVITSGANRLLEVCQAFRTTVHPRPHGRLSIINVTTQTDGVRTSMACAAIETMTRSIATDTQLPQTQANCIILSVPEAPTTDGDLAHSLLFLSSPASAWVTGSVLRIRSSVGPSSQSQQQQQQHEEAAEDPTTVAGGNSSALVQATPVAPGTVAPIPTTTGAAASANAQTVATAAAAAAVPTTVIAAPVVTAFIPAHEHSGAA